VYFITISSSEYFSYAIIFNLDMSLNLDEKKALRDSFLYLQKFVHALPDSLEQKECLIVLDKRMKEFFKKPKSEESRTN